MVFFCFLKFYVQYRFRQRETIFEYFKKETEKCNATLKDVEKKQIDIDDDEDDLRVLRDYLVVYDVSSERICQEHKKVGLQVTTSGSQLEAATGGVLHQKLFSKIPQYSQENTCVGVLFK